MKRAYRSTLRSSAKQDTRDRILDAMVDVVTREGVHAFSVPNVAAAAGVALRTVYRHFATREALLDGLDDLLERRAANAAIELPNLSDITALPQQVAAAFHACDVFRDAMRAYVIISVALGRRVPSFDRRTRLFAEGLARSFPGLSRQDAKHTAAVLRLLVSTRAWFYLTTDHEMSTNEAVRAVEWATRTLLADLARRPKKRTRRSRDTA